MHQPRPGSGTISSGRGRFQNKNLNVTRPGRGGPIIQNGNYIHQPGKRVAHSIGGAAVPVPANTSSLKKETNTSSPIPATSAPSSGAWNSSDKSDSVPKPVSQSPVVSKLAPWAKSNAPQAPTDQKPSSSRNWAEESSDEEEDEGETRGPENRAVSYSSDARQHTESFSSQERRPYPRPYHEESRGGGAADRDHGTRRDFNDQRRDSGERRDYSDQRRDYDQRREFGDQRREFFDQRREFGDQRRDYGGPSQSGFRSGPGSFGGGGGRFSSNQPPPYHPASNRYTGGRGGYPEERRTMSDSMRHVSEATRESRGRSEEEQLIEASRRELHELELKKRSQQQHRDDFGDRERRGDHGRSSSRDFEGDRYGGGGGGSRGGYDSQQGDRYRGNPASYGYSRQGQASGADSGTWERVKMPPAPQPEHRRLDSGPTHGEEGKPYSSFFPKASSSHAEREALQRFDGSNAPEHSVMHARPAVNPVDMRERGYSGHSQQDARSDHPTAAVYPPPPQHQHQHPQHYPPSASGPAGGKPKMLFDPASSRYDFVDSRGAPPHPPSNHGGSHRAPPQYQQQQQQMRRVEVAADRKDEKWSHVPPPSGHSHQQQHHSHVQQEEADGLAAEKSPRSPTSVLPRPPANRPDATEDQQHRQQAPHKQHQMKASSDYNRRTSRDDITPTPEVPSRQALDESKKAVRALERQNREPRTNGLLFRYVEGSGGRTIERVLSKSEAAAESKVNEDRKSRQHEHAKSNGGRAEETLRHSNPATHATSHGAKKDSGNTPAAWDSAHAYNRMAGLTDSNPEMSLSPDSSALSKEKKTISKAVRKEDEGVLFSSGLHSQYDNVAYSSLGNSNLDITQIAAAAADMSFQQPKMTFIPGLGISGPSALGNFSFLTDNSPNWNYAQNDSSVPALPQAAGFSPFGYTNITEVPPPAPPAEQAAVVDAEDHQEEEEDGDENEAEEGEEGPDFAHPGRGGSRRGIRGGRRSGGRLGSRSGRGRSAGFSGRSSSRDFGRRSSRDHNREAPPAVKEKRAVAPEKGEASSAEHHPERPDSAHQGRGSFRGGRGSGRSDSRSSTRGPFAGERGGGRGRGRSSDRSPDRAPAADSKQ